MTKIKNFTAKIILSVLIILAFFMAQNISFFGNFSYRNCDQITTQAIIEESDLQDVSSKISNNNFNQTSSGSESTTGSTSVLSPSSWTKTGDINSTNMRAGVITIADETSFNQKVEDYLLSDGDYPNGTTGTSSGNKVLFIRSKTPTTFGFKSADIELDANSYYAITAKYYTGEGYASFGISSTNLTSTNKTIIKNLDSNSNWAYATIFISTS